ncbi:uncharacterized protein LOC129787513 isoform X2 [Lutzomyia longipalpis]|nr:uncharacterized protein LOC129787513 isoform X2 [Lutzomyia longipalpis]
MNDRTLWSQAEYKGFDGNAGRNYVYPKNTDKHQYREYQYKICKEAFFQNTLVVLPDGLGKSFIASVVMYNIYRWYPMSKVIFLSANKSILRAQMEACSNIMNIPKGDCVEITGKNSTARANMWRKHRILFGTPRQILLDFQDIPSIPFGRIKLLVVTEAHKARGANDPFAPIIAILQNHTEHFRILALTSVLGKKLTETADIVRNLRISHIEIRQENSPDVAAFVNKSTVRPLEVKLTEQFRMIRKDFFYAIDPYLKILLFRGVVSGNFCKAKLIASKRKFTEASLTEKPTDYHELLRVFDISIDFFVASDYLNDYGVLSFLKYMENDFLREAIAKDKDNNSRLLEYLQSTRSTFARVLAIGDEDSYEVDEELHENIIVGHPKIGEMEKVLNEHFQKNSESRLVIFSNCPTTSSLIYHCLQHKCPQLRSLIMIRPQGMSESERNCTRLKLNRGTINTLIVSNIPDEVIMNEVNFIICYDTTGRHLKQFIRSRVASCSGKKCELLVVVHEGQDMATQSELWREKFEHNEDINRSPAILGALFDQSPRLVPVEFNPVNLTPIVSGRVAKTKRPDRSIDDYFKNVPTQRCLPLNTQQSDNVLRDEIVVPLPPPPPTPIPSATGENSLVAPLRTLPLQIICERVAVVEEKKFSNLAYDGNLESILRQSALVSHTQDFLMDLLNRTRMTKTDFGVKYGRFHKFLVGNSTSNGKRVDYFTSIVGNVMKKLNGTVDDVKGDEMSQYEETLHDIPDLNTGFIDPERKASANDGDPTRESICGETTLSFFLISSFSELFERDASGSDDVFEMRICDKKFNVDNEAVSDGEEEVIPSSQENIRVGRRRAAAAAMATRCRLLTSKKDTSTHIDGHVSTVEDTERKARLQIHPIPSSDSDDKFDLGSIDSIFNSDGIIFEHFMTEKGTATPPRIPSPHIEQHSSGEFGSPSMLGRRRRENSARLKHSNNNASDSTKEMNSAYIPHAATAADAGTSRQSSDEFFVTCHDSSDTQLDGVYGTCRDQNSKDVVQKSKGSRAQRRLQSVNEYIYFEASASDDDDNADAEGTNRLLDSIVVESDSEDEQIEQLNKVNDIQAKYLQSVRSPPTVRRGAFYIPHPEKYRNVVDVFSQTQLPDASEYVNDTFVVDDVDESDSDLSLLEQAEAILKTRRRKRQKMDRGGGERAKRQRIRVIDDSSDDDDDDNLHGVGPLE